MYEIFQTEKDELDLKIKRFSLWCFCYFYTYDYSKMLVFQCDNYYWIQADVAIGFFVKNVVCFKLFNKKQIPFPVLRLFETNVTG